MNIQLNELTTLIAEAAHDELMGRFRQVGSSEKTDGSLVTEADLAMQARVEGVLRERWPTIPLLGEEMESAAQQALLDEPGEGLWILDPLDGTTNYAAGIPYFAVSLALMDGEGVRLGLIHDPVRGETFSAERGRGAWLNGEPLRVTEKVRAIRHCVAEVDLKRLAKPLAAKVAAEHPFASQRQLGSAALDWCWLAADRVHLYLHGGQSLWDYAAAQLILSEAGGHAATLDGESVLVRALVKRSVYAAAGEALFSEWGRWLGVESNS